MPRRKSTTLTPLELEIMKVLWERGAANVQTVQDALPGEKLAYTSVQTMLNVLQKKGKARRTLKDRAYVYRPAQSRLQAMGQSIRDLVERMFDGSPEALVMGLLETKQLTPEKLAELQQRLKEKRDAGL
jgi:predicted transcriptional regulator